MTIKRPSVGSLFAASGTGQSHQILQLKDHVAELEAEVLRLRTNPETNADLEQQIQVLTEKLSQQEGVHEIEISLIDPDPNQPRQTITAAMKQARADSLRKHGQLSPIILIPQPTGRYLLFDGELRWQSAPLVPLSTLQAVFLRQEQSESDIDIFRGQLLTRLHAEDLHDLDLAEALIQDIHNHLGIPDLTNKDDIPALLESAIRHLRKTNHFAELSKLKGQPQQSQQAWIVSVKFPRIEMTEIMLTLLELQLNPASIAANIFPLLKLPDDIKKVIRETGLDSSKARTIARIKDDEQREEILAATITDNLSLTEIKERIAQLQSPLSSSSPTLKQQFTETIKQLQKSEVWNDPSKQKKLQKLLDQIRELEL